MWTAGCSQQLARAWPVRLQISDHRHSTHQCHVSGMRLRKSFGASYFSAGGSPGSGAHASEAGRTREHQREACRTRARVQVHGEAEPAHLSSRERRTRERSGPDARASARGVPDARVCRHFLLCKTVASATQSKL